MIYLSSPPILRYSAAMYTQLTRLFIQAPIFVSFFLVIISSNVHIENMVEKVPSIQTGGASWFIDLTTANVFYILPLLAAISCWITVEFTMQEGKRGGVWKNIARGGAALTLPLTASFPNVSITSQLFFLIMKIPTFSLVETFQLSFVIGSPPTCSPFLFGLTIKKPSVKKFLNISIIVPPSPSPANIPFAFVLNGIYNKTCGKY
uniref:Uncharacterized protein n=1 Tax=Lactuca sativa TaxID=4236 RepID=A0A9R1VU94_LACSA|nr:hypothetical protein LSAT_V11C400196070 [Lactuca sativa]